MAISLTQIKDELYPGLAAIQGRYALERSWRETMERHAALVFNQGTTWTQTLAAPHIWVPKPAEIVLGAAALAAKALIENKPVTRRFWQGWLSGGAK